MKILVALLATLIAVSVCIDKDKWDSLNEEQQFQILKYLILYYAEKYGVQEVEVLIDEQGDEVIINIGEKAKEVSL